MPGLTLSGQGQQRRTLGGGAGSWWIAIVLIVISVMLITLCVRMDNAGPFAVARSAVQTVTKPIAALCAPLSTPFNGLNGHGADDEVARLKQENEQLRTLVAELEEYRQQGQRLTTLTKMNDIYGLESVSAHVIGVSGGWNRTATINKGSDAGIQVGMGVMSTCGLYGQVESVTSGTATIRLINDSQASAAAMIQNSRARGIVSGSYDGTLTLEYVPVDTKVAEGDIVISSGQGGVYPRGIIIGTVHSIDKDSSKLYYRIVVDPIFNIESCEEVLVLTGKESETQSVLDTELLESITKAASAQEEAQTAAQAASDASALPSEGDDAAKKEGESAQATGAQDASDGQDQTMYTTTATSSEGSAQ